MVSTKALAAIALTLVIVIPIGIGFLTAVHQEETDSWQTTSSSKISDLMLNHQTPYYGSYKGASNNATLWKDGDLVAPSYVTITSSNTSLPTYTQTTTTVTLPETAWTSPHEDTGRYGVAPWQYGYLYADNIVGTHDYYKLAGEVRLYEPGFSDLNDDFVWSSYTADITLIRNSASTWAAYNGNTLVNDNVAFWVQWKGDRIGSYAHVTYKEFTEVTTATPYSGMVNMGAMKIGNDYNVGTFSFQVGADSITIAGLETEYDSLPSIYVVQSGNIGLNTVTPSGYADPSDGWTVPSTSGTYQWLNNQVNESVTFYVKPVYGVGEYCTIGDLRIQPSGSQIKAYLTSEGVYQTLGAYEYMQVVVSSTGYTVTGIPYWPSMGTVPTTYNQISFDDPGNVFNHVDIQATSQDWHFRVDNANIEQGSYPSTYDYSLNLQQIYPDTNIDIYLNSIGVYGDYINFGGALLTVDNGAVEINGKTYRLLHAHLSAWNEGSHYSLRINGDEVATTSEPPTIFWGGEWSVTATAYKIEQVHEYVTVWHAGEFGLDKKGFAVAGLLACGALLVALGLSGQRSGGKMGVLLLICGGAAVVYLLII